jgi:polar amino acid transport system substrate-binding protein
MKRWFGWLGAISAALLLAFPVLAAPLVIYTEELPPLNYTRDGELTGLSVEMVREIQKRIGDSTPTQVVPWARGYKAALEQPNVALFSTTRTEEREKLFKWVGPLTRWNYVFYKKRGSPITLNSLDDARQVETIATYRDDAREQFLKQKGFINLESSPKLISCARKLMEGRVDLWLDSNLTAHQVVQNAGYNPADLEPVLTVKTNHLYIAFSLATADSVVEQWQSALNDMVGDGSYQAIYQRWLPEESPPILASLTPALMQDLKSTRIYTENLQPINYIDDGKLTGVSTEIVHEILRRIGLATNIEVVPWARGYTRSLENANVALFSTARSSYREESFKWVGPLIDNVSVIYAKKGSGIIINSLDDAMRVDSIGSYNYDVDEQFLKQLGFQNIYSHPNPSSAVRNLMSGRVNLWIAGSSYALHTTYNAGFSCNDLEALYTIRDANYYIAFSQQTADDIVAVWQLAFDEMQRDGTLDAIRLSWDEKLQAQDQARGCSEIQH